MSRVGGSPFSPTAPPARMGPLSLSFHQLPHHQRISLPSKRYHSLPQPIHLRQYSCFMPTNHPRSSLIVITTRDFRVRFCLRTTLKQWTAAASTMVVEGIRVARPLFLFQSEREPLPPFLLPSLLLFSPHHLSIHPSTVHLISVSASLSLSLLCCFRRHHRHPSSLSLPFFLLPSQKSLAE